MRPIGLSLCEPGDEVDRCGLSPIVSGQFGRTLSQEEGLHDLHRHGDRCAGAQVKQDFTVATQDIQNLLADNGGVPVAADINSVTDPKNKKLIGDYKTLADNNAFGFYPDWPVPGFYDVLVAGTQKLINGSASPQSVLSGFASSYNENLPSH